MILRFALAITITGMLACTATGLMKGKPWFAFIGDDGRIRWYDFDNTTTPLGMK